jgi:hypothetical protein
MPLTKNNKKYGNEILKEALDQINNGEISIYAAGKKYKIPYGTLWNHLQKKNFNLVGAVKILTDVQEKELVDWILLCANYGNPKCRVEILKAAGEIATLLAHAHFTQTISGT